MILSRRRGVQQVAARMFRRVALFGLFLLPASPRPPHAALRALIATMVWKGAEPMPCANWVEFLRRTRHPLVGAPVAGAAKARGRR